MTGKTTITSRYAYILSVKVLTLYKNYTRISTLTLFVQVPEASFMCVFTQSICSEMGGRHMIFEGYYRGSALFQVYLQHVDCLRAATRSNNRTRILTTKQISTIWQLLPMPWQPANWIYYFSWPLTIHCRNKKRFYDRVQSNGRLFPKLVQDKSAEWILKQRAENTAPLRSYWHTQENASSFYSTRLDADAMLFTDTEYLKLLLFTLHMYVYNRNNTEHLFGETYIRILKCTYTITLWSR